MTNKTTPGKEDTNRLFAAATQVMHNAHAPYSGFTVGAALLTESGDIITGCNVENASYGATICAERSAIAAAVAQGHKNFTAICVTTAADSATPPCGICRQTLMEFNPDMTVICRSQNGEEKTYSAKALLPHAFTADDL